MNQNFLASLKHLLSDNRLMDKVRPKKKFGQHFLTDLRVAERLAAIVEKESVKEILEVGPGTGVLTQFLLKNNPKNLKVVEIDSESVAYLNQHFKVLMGHIIAADFLKLNLENIFSGPFILVGNYPYNISTQIVFKIIEHRDRIPFMAGMFQLEVAKRIVSNKDTKDYGILSVLTQAFFEVTLEFIVEPGAFNPPPKVRSAVISCRLKAGKNLGCSESLFFQVVKTGFGQRRKMLSNALGRFNVPKELLLNNPFAKLRAENLSVEDFVELTNFVEQNLK